MVTLGPNELLTIHEADDAAYFVLVPANAAFGQTQLGLTQLSEWTASE